MIWRNGKIAASAAAFLMGWVLMMAPTTAAADDAESMQPLELEPPPQIADDLEDDVEERGIFAGQAAAGGGLGARSFLTISGGTKFGPTGVAGYGFDNHGTITDDRGEQVHFPNADHEPWIYPEYYGHGGAGGGAGLYAEARLNEFLGLEVGMNRTRNTAWGHVDKNVNGVTVSRIESRQVTWSTHIPILVKGVIPSETARPFLGGGIEIVTQTSSMIEYEEDRKAGQYGHDGAIEELNERNQVETTTYPLLAVATGIEIVADPFVIPVEVRLGYALTHDRDDMDSRAWYDSENEQIVYDGVFMSHFALFTGLVYEFEFIP